MTSLFGGGSSAPRINYSPGGFISPGASASFSGGKYSLTDSPGTTSAIGSIQSTFGQQAGALGALRGQVAPGFSDFRKAGLDQLNTQQQATTSNLRDNLAQRRILGSSFAQASLSQSDADFAEKKANFTAQSYLQEIAASQELIQQQYQATVSGYKVALDQLNLDTNTAATLTQGANSAMASVATAQAQLDQQSAQANAAGMGKLLGTAAAVGLAPFTGGASLAAIPAMLGGGGGGGGGGLSGGGGTGFGGGLTLPGGYSSFADAGITSGVGTGGYNFMDAQA